MRASAAHRAAAGCEAPREAVDASRVAVSAKRPIRHRGRGQARRPRPGCRLALQRLRCRRAPSKGRGQHLALLGHYDRSPEPRSPRTPRTTTLQLPHASNPHKRDASAARLRAGSRPRRPSSAGRPHNEDGDARLCVQGPSEAKRWIYGSVWLWLARLERFNARTTDSRCPSAAASLNFAPRPASPKRCHAELQHWESLCGA